MKLRIALLMLPFALPLILGSGCVKRIYTDAEIPTIGDIEAVMHAQAQLAGPAMKKAGAASFTEEDWASFTAVASRVKLTAARTKTWSKGPGFDQLADQLGASADELALAAAAKDVDKAKAALGAMGATCKSCHSKFD